MITIIIILIIAIAILTYMVKQRNTWLDKANKKIDQLSMSKTAIEEENETLKTYLSNAVIDREKYKVMLKKSEEVRKKLCEEKIHGSNKIKTSRKYITLSTRPNNFAD